MITKSLITKAENYMSSFKEDRDNEVRKMAYIQGAADYKDLISNLLSAIVFPKSMGSRQGFYETGFKDGVEEIKRRINNT